MHRLAALAVLLGALTGASTLHAAPDAAGYEFAFELGETTVELDYPHGPADTTVKSIGFSARERFGESLWLGLHGGYAFMSQDGNPSTAGRELDGYYAGVSLAATPFGTPTLAVQTEASYRYRYGKDEQNAQAVRIELHEAVARLGVSAAIAPRFRFVAGVAYGVVDAQQRVSGSTNATVELDRNSAFGAFAALELGLGNGGHVGADWRSDVARVWQIYLKRVY